MRGDHDGKEQVTVSLLGNYAFECPMQGRNERPGVSIPVAKVFAGGPQSFDKRVTRLYFTGQVDI